MDASRATAPPAPSEEARVHQLQLAHDAMRVSIDALTVLVDNERVQTRVAKRRLAAALATASPDHLARARAEFSARDASLAEAAAALRAAQDAEAREREARARAEADLEALAQRLREGERKVEEAERYRERVGGEVGKRLAAVERKLREEEARGGALAEVVKEVPALRGRVKELEEEVEGKDDMLRVWEGGGEGDQSGRVDVKRKLVELRVARNVIVGKDAAVKEMRQQLADADARRLEAVVAGKVSERQAHKAEAAVAELREDVGKAQEEAEEERRARVDAERKAKEAAGHLAALNKQNNDLRQKLSASESGKLYRAQCRATAEGQIRIVEVRCAEAIAKFTKTKAALEDSEKRVAYLEDTVRKGDVSLEDDMSGTSPCSTDADAEDGALSNISQCNSAERLTKLEGAVRQFEADYEEKCLETQKLTSSLSEKAETIATLEKDLLASGRTCEGLHRKLHAGDAEIKELNEKVRHLEVELSLKREVCCDLESRIDDDLEPALRDMNKLLDERNLALKTAQQDHERHQEKAEKMRLSLKQEIVCVSERLENTVTALNSTQHRLTQSEQRAADLEGRVLGHIKEKNENVATINELSSDLKHRQQALIALQSRLVSVESRVGKREQIAHDAIRNNEQLKRSLLEAHEKLSTAEKRAARKDALVDELEGRAHVLEHNHAVLREHLNEKLVHLEAAERDIEEYVKVIDVKDEALRCQASIVRRKESFFTSMVDELRNVVADRNKEIETAKEDLRTTERRVKVLEETLHNVGANLKGTEQELAQSQDERSNLEAERRRQNARLEEAQEEISSLRAQYRGCREELSLKDRQISTQATSLVERGGEIVGLHAEKEELENMIRESRDELDTETRVSSGRARQVVALEKALTDVASDLASTKEELSARDSEVESLGHALNSVRGEVVGLKEEVADKEQELNARVKDVRKTKEALVYTNHQLEILESHLNGHDALLKDCREKEKLLAQKCTELEEAEESLAHAEANAESSKERLVAQTKIAESLAAKSTSAENDSARLTGELEAVRKAKTCAESALNKTTTELAALQKATNEENRRLKDTIASLRRFGDEKENSLSSALEQLSQTTSQSKLAKEQLANSRSRGDRLFARLTSAEHDLAAKKELLATLEVRFVETKNQLKSRDDEIKTVRRALADRDQALSLSNSRVENLATRTKTVSTGELVSFQSKLNTKEKAIANLHNWCCFINGKLHAAEKRLSERETELEASTAALDRMKSRVQNLNETIVAKDFHNWELETKQGAENTELRSRIKSLEGFVLEVDSAVSTEGQAMSTDNIEELRTAPTLGNELQAKQRELVAKEAELSQVHARCESLQDTVGVYGRDLRDARRTIETLSLDIDELRKRVESTRVSEDSATGNAGTQTSQMHSESAYLLIELRRVQAELAAANEDAATWQAKVDELQPLAATALEDRRSVEALSARVSLAEKDAKNRIDLLEMQLEAARRERDAAERDSSAAMSDYGAMRARLADAHATGSAYQDFAAPDAVCSLTFTLDGIGAPGPEITVYVLGGDESLGRWDPTRRIPLHVVGEGRNGVIRKCDVVLPASLSAMYKFVADGSDGNLVWEDGENRLLELRQDTLRVLHDTWRQPV